MFELEVIQPSQIETFKTEYIAHKPLKRNLSRKPKIFIQNSFEHLGKKESR